MCRIIKVIHLSPKKKGIIKRNGDETKSLKGIRCIAPLSIWYLNICSSKFLCGNSICLAKYGFSFSIDNYSYIGFRAWIMQ